MQKYKSVLFAVCVVVVVFFGALLYRNYYLKELTENNLSTLVGAIRNGKVRDYHNTIGVKSSADVTYEYNALLRVYVVRYGNYSVYLSAEDENSWSLYKLEEPLNMIGITFELKGSNVVFYYNGEELSLRD